MRTGGGGLRERAGMCGEDGLDWEVRFSMNAESGSVKKDGSGWWKNEVSYGTDEKSGATENICQCRRGVRI